MILMGASALVYVSMTGCSSMVASSVTSLNNEITVMRQDVDRGTPNSCYKLVQQYDKLAALKSYSFEARIDYEFIKQACVALLEKKYILHMGALDKNAVATVLNELKLIDPVNATIQSHYEYDRSDVSILSLISPTSKVIRENNSYYLKYDDRVGVKKYLMMSLDDFDFDLADRKKEYDSSESSSELINEQISLRELLNKMTPSEFQFKLSEDIQGKQVSPKLKNKIESMHNSSRMIDVMAEISIELKLNFALFNDGIYVYANPPARGGGEKVFSNIKVENESLSSIVPVFKNIFGDSSVLCVDTPTNVVWCMLDSMKLM